MSDRAKSDSFKSASSDSSSSSSGGSKGDGAARLEWTQVDEDAIGTTFISCLDAPTQERHRVTLHRDGSISCGCGPSAVAEGRRQGVAVVLGGDPLLLRRSCRGFVAYLEVGLAHAAANARAETAKGPWTEMQKAYRTNALVEKALARLRDAREGRYEEAHRVAREALESCVPFYGDEAREGILKGVKFRSGRAIRSGLYVGAPGAGAWKVPLTKDWLETVGRTNPIIAQRFVVGWSEREGYVYAIARTTNRWGHPCFEIQEFALVGGALEPVGG